MSVSSRIDRVRTKYGTFTVPRGMRSDLIRKLVEDDSFAHAWLCHGVNREECPDGCDSCGDPIRTLQYGSIERVSEDV